MDADPCSVPWGGLIVVLACIAILALVYMGMAAARVAAQNAWDAEWRAWQGHLARVAGDLVEARQVTARLADAVGPPSRATATLVGSAATGALQNTSDVDVKVVVARCSDYLDVARDVQRTLGLTHVFSGDAFALFSGVLPRSGRAIDVSVEMATPKAPPAPAAPADKDAPADAPADGTAAPQLVAAPQPDASNARIRGFLEHVIRRRHGDVTVRRSKHASL
jgi:hypothetical protein